MGVSTPGAADLAVRHEIGIDRFMWGSDYPHDEGSHPYTREHLRSRLSGIAPAEVRKILSENAAQLYGFDLEALAPLAAQVGPAVAELATPIEEVPEKELARLSDDMDSTDPRSPTPLDCPPPQPRAAPSWSQPVRSHGPAGPGVEPKT